MKSTLAKAIRVFGTSLAVATVSGAALATPVQWTVANGGNDHWYEAISAPNMSWTAAKAAAEAQGGYLATITSAAENAFIAALVPAYGSSLQPYWLGGFQDPSFPEPPFTGGWQWVTGEAWTYTNFAGGEPNNAAEDSLAFAFFSTAGTWNDAPTNYTGYGNGGYVVEVPEPASMALLGLGLLGLGFSRRKKA